MRYTDGHFLETRISTDAHSYTLILFLGANKGSILTLFNWLTELLISPIRLFG